MYVIYTLWALSAIPYGCILKMFTGPMPAAPSHLSLFRRLEYYLYHHVYRQTLLAVSVFAMFGYLLIAIEEGLHGRLFKDNQLFLDFLTSMATIAVACLFGTVYGRRASPEAEAQVVEETNDLYLTVVQYYWY
ncbi:uncharacterized protein FFB20_04960 [Fusarium fujikuroi]|uniref:Uncharacterized protein n=2 Tax=Fusarium fujikuroi TaxID=5127 RepID=S0EG13_GIBF5|nr:uncharacterized protein FFUJ_09468 [Fusarium fujikuroi IMI 58289]KLP00153.1 uncharacterized protein Y057_2705 [Fusarium fujikuroi]KLP22243.1 uncharacterized protein LW94_3185 [Fusarium fujikuroi]QGI69339.1 hypothetical protein CEK27_013310 [Fusarium fujikuroi]QGI86702.1 hypothetical protein CEK25_013431 [Fusarium fujikuroi]QGJ00228.1 hypothetical protein CEK26_013296 [Fusarium fujikuroi]